MKRTTLQSMANYRPELRDAHVHQSVRPSPGWCEGSYLRTLESLEDRNAEERDHVLLWVIAMIERQWGYALDIARAHEQRFAQDSVSSLLRDLPLRLVLQKDRKARSVVGQFLPPRFKRFLKQLIQG